MFHFDKADLKDLISAYREDPESYEANLFLGLSLAGSRTRQPEAEPFLMKAMSAGKVDIYTKTLLRRLAWVKSCQADYAAAASVCKMATDMFPNDPFLMLEYAGALTVIGDLEHASEIQGEVISILRESSRTFAIKEKQPLAVILEPQSLIRKFVGEMAAKLDLYVKSRTLGLIDDARAFLCTAAPHNANGDFADYWRKYVEVVTDPGESLRLSNHYHKSWVLTDYVRLPDGRALQRDAAYRVVQNLWEQQGRAPLLTLKDEHREKGEAFLNDLGMPKGSWFVTMHVRSTGYYLEDEMTSPNFHRNSDIVTYLPAIEEIVKRGGWVVRIGDTSMPPLPKMAQVIDYAHLDHTFGWLDVFFIAACRFFIGTSSGPVTMAENFGTRILGTNWCAGGAWLACRGDIFMHKLLRRKADGRLMTLAEMMKPPFFTAIEPLLYRKEGLEVVDNSPEDIRDGVIEMLDTLEGKHGYSDEEETLQRAFKAKADPYKLGLNSRAATGFLRRHPELLDLT